MRLAKLRKLGGPSQLQAGCAAGLLRRQAPAAMLLDQHVEVRFEFQIEVAVETGGPEERPQPCDKL
jgi:hypothetical protein